MPRAQRPKLVRGDCADGSEGEMSPLDRIGQTLAPVMLRRRKAEVLTQLPERVDNRIFVPLTPEQRVY